MYRQVISLSLLHRATASGAAPAGLIANVSGNLLLCVTDRQSHCRFVVLVLVLVLVIVVVLFLFLLLLQLLVFVYVCLVAVVVVAAADTILLEVDVNSEASLVAKSRPGKSCIATLRI